MSEEKFFKGGDVDSLVKKLIDFGQKLEGEERKLFDLMLAVSAREVLDSQGREIIEPVIQDLGLSTQLALKRFKDVNNTVEYDDNRLSSLKPKNRKEIQ